MSCSPSRRWWTRSRSRRSRPTSRRCKTVTGGRRRHGGVPVGVPVPAVGAAARAGHRAEEGPRRAGRQQRAFNRKPVGTGPYTLVEWRSRRPDDVEGQRELLGGAPKVTDVTVVFAADDNVRAPADGGRRVRRRVAAAEAGQVVQRQGRLPGGRQHERRLPRRRPAGRPADHLGPAGAARGEPRHRPPGDGRHDPRRHRQARRHTGVAGAVASGTTRRPTFAFDKAEASRLLDAAGWANGRGRHARPRTGRRRGCRSCTRATTRCARTSRSPPPATSPKSVSRPGGERHVRADAARRQNDGRAVGAAATRTTRTAPPTRCCTPVTPTPAATST